MSKLRQFPKAQKPFWEIKAAAGADGAPSVTDLWIYDVIGDDWWDPSLTAKELCQRIAAIDSDEIMLHMASPGGSVPDGIAIYNALAAHPARVTARIEGWTSSIATIVALAAESVIMFDNVMWIIHKPSGRNVGDDESMHEYGEFLTRIGQQMTSIYMSRCTKSEEELAAALAAETYMTAAEAAEWGFVDEVIAGQAAAAIVDLGRLEAVGLHPLEGVRRTVESRRPPDPPETPSGDARPTIDHEALASLLLASRRH